MEAGVAPLPGGAWVEVDLDAIAHNLAVVRRLAGDRAGIMAVVKANAYGHGAVEVARQALRAGAERLGVFSLAEAEELRRAGITAPLLVFAPPRPGEAARMVALDLVATVVSLEAARELEAAARAAGRRVKVHVEADGGLNRFGLPPAQTPGFLRALASLPHVEVEGLYTHLPERDGRLQARFRAFQDLLRRLEEEGLRPPLAHAASSAVLLRVPGAQLDLVRVGNLMYGFAPAGPRPDLRRAWRLRAVVSQVRRVARGETVGYAGEFVASRAMRVAVLPVGFADGFMVDVTRPVQGWRDLLRRVALEGWRGLRLLVRGDGVTFSGRGARLVGRVGMQHTCVDVTALPDVEAGAVATLSARCVLASPRLPRVYLRDGCPVGVAPGEGAATPGPAETVV